MSSNKVTNKVDATAVNQAADLLSLAAGLTTLRRVAGTRGGEYAGPCPWCGGTDRFRVQPAAGAWTCRQCQDGRWGDAIALVMQRDRCDFRTACAALTGQPMETEGRTPMTAPPAAPRELTAPPVGWQDAATDACRDAADYLWSDRGRTARDWLHKRGLTDETIQRARLGFVPAARTDGDVYLEAGITIPWYWGQDLWQVKIRRRPSDVQAGKDKYANFKGGHPSLYVPVALAPDRPLVLCEGEFDAMLLWQAIHNRAEVASLGSAGAGKTPLPRQVKAALLRHRPILIALDADVEGQAGAEALRRQLPHSVVLRLPTGKDITEAYLAGVSLHDWVESYLRDWQAQQADERPQAAPAAPLAPAAAPNPEPVQDSQLDQCDEPGCSRPPYVSRDPVTGAYCVDHGYRWEFLNAGAVLGWPEVPGYVKAGEDAWRSMGMAESAAMLRLVLRRLEKQAATAQQPSLV